MKTLGENIDKRFESIDMQMSEIRNNISNLMYSIFGTLIVLAGYILWDRRTTLSPVKEETKKFAERGLLPEKIINEFALKQPELSKILKTNGLL